MMAPTEGRAVIAGHDVVRDPAAVRRQVGVVFQTQSLDKALTVEENLRAQGHLHGLSGAVLRERMERAMERLGLADRRNDLVETLSGGLRRRVEIAKALLHRPQVLLMDEASTGLDPAARRDLSRHVEEPARERRRHHSAHHPHSGRSRPLRPPGAAAPGTYGGRGHARANCARASAAMWWCSKPPTPRRWPRSIERRFGVRPVVMDGEVRVEIANGHRFIAEVVEAFPGAIESVGLHKPTLEDVFVRRDGSPLSNFWLPAATLWQRELVRFWRQKSRVLGVVASPLVFWLLIGYGSNDLARFYSGALVLTVMFSAIFSTISIIEDRREGFLLSMLVSPAPRTSMVLGKILGSATLAWIQGLIFLAFAPLAGVSIHWPRS